jgi:hypothetical protein
VGTAANIGINTFHTGSLVVHGLPAGLPWRLWLMGQGTGRPLSHDSTLRNKNALVSSSEHNRVQPKTNKKWTGISILKTELNSSLISCYGSPVLPRYYQLVLPRYYQLVVWPCKATPPERRNSMLFSRLCAKPEWNLPASQKTICFPGCVVRSMACGISERAARPIQSILQRPWMLH